MLRTISEFNYINEFKKFITGQYLTKGLRITVGAILPAWILYRFNLLSVGIALPLGALMVSLTDSPGPIHHRRNGMLASNIFNFIVAIIIGYTRSYPWLLAVELTVLGFFLSFTGIYGNRANAIGLIAIIVMVLNIDVHSGQERVMSDALFMLGGGVWYMLLSLLLYSLKPYRLIQQALGECIMLTASYLKTKSKLYKSNVVYDEVYKELLPLQISIHHQQEQLRELLFKARGFTRESTTRGRVLLMMFIDSVDLFEQVMTSQQNYKSLHEYFKEGNILEQFRRLILETANELDKIGLVIQSGFPSRDTNGLSMLIGETEDAFVAYRDVFLKPGNLEGFISLRHILNSVKDIADRIKRLRRYTAYNSETHQEIKHEIDAGDFVSRQEFDPKLLAENFSLKSNIFRHSLRVSLCILAGYIIAQFLPFGHGYWILLTTVTILKPAYSISKKRNVERLMGTLAGAGAGFLLLYNVQTDTVLFGIMIIVMIVGYSFLQIRYSISVAAITVYVLLAFHFLHPADFKSLATDRVIDTAIGSAISFTAAFFFLPRWEREQVNEYIHKLMEANLRYFSIVARAFYATAPQINAYKIARKDAYVALANLSDAFQRLLSEPKNKTKQAQLLHHLVVSNHMLTSHIATLGIYMQSLAPRYHSDAFKAVADSIERQMGIALSQNSGSEPADPAEKGFAQIRDIIHDLLAQRVSELTDGAVNSNVRKTLSGFKTITDQFELIYTITIDINKVLGKLKFVPEK
ncbi:FUSC family membrane protein [Agriterribacter sp.]|uniref:FUSC family protein n=1 Tax=Agriterribacter sp. TaxID=2821509 RepID=UPI002B8010A2|nr:FUSC family membrane protein [Agriterribacter sp.]HRP55112.1 FUSC family membrane protein [Agriterribacter sp.]